MSQGGITIIYEPKQRLSDIRKEKSEILKKIVKLPEGNFYIAKNNTSTQWYRWHNGHDIYISKKKRRLAEQLAIRKYLSYKLEDLTAEELSLLNYIQSYENNFKNKSNTLLENSAYQDLLSKYFKTSSQEISDWINEDFIQSNEYPEDLIVPCLSGHIVRSKSEQLIDLLLMQHSIPFRYECQLKINGHTIYPDFTIKRPRDGKIIYWEHFGKIDNLSYLSNNRAKIETYFTNGIIPGDNLIMTFETGNIPLDAMTVDNMISMYLL